MGEIESIFDYCGKAITITNQIRSNGNEMDDIEIIEKMLRSLLEKF